MLTPHDMLNSVLLLHIAWMLDIEQMTVKAVATASGFLDPSSFRNFVARHARRTPRSLRDDVGFGGCLEAAAIGGFRRRVTM
jgi:transcriptional regulator GlxA family with amidase domain